MRFAHRSRPLPFHQRYLAYTVDGEQLRLPLLNIRLIGPSDTLKTIALVDSGATLTFIPPELAAAVGLEPEKRGEQAIGAGGAFANDLCPYRIQLLKKDQPIRDLEGVAFVPQEADRVPYVVLGRDSIFRIYDITFRENRQMVLLKPASRHES